MARRFQNGTIYGALIACLGLAAPAWTDGIAIPSEVEVLCNDRGLSCRRLAGSFATADGSIAGEFMLSFADASQLRPGSFDVAVELIDPDELEAAGRLPRGVFIPSDFPVLIRIDPSRQSQLSFRGEWSLEIVTENLEFTSNSPLRLLRSPNGGRFEDISEGLGSGSFRVLGSSARFSEFVIGRDLRPARAIVAQKFQRLAGVLQAVGEEVPGNLLSELTALLGEAQAAQATGDVETAIRRLAAFVRVTRMRIESDLPGESAPGEDRFSPAALLLAEAETLLHSLEVDQRSARSGRGGFRELRNPEGRYPVEIVAELEGAFDIDPDDFEIEAVVIDPKAASFASRLPEGVQVPEEFPVLVKIEPKAGSEQAFNGELVVELSTEVLDFDPRLRLFKAPDGGAFEDVTRSLGLGSFRVQGSSARFSDFVIALDQRDIGIVLGEKIDRMFEIFEEHGEVIPEEIIYTLLEIVDQVGEAIEQDDYEAAIAGLVELAELVLEHSDEIPSVWRSDLPTANVAGELRSLAESTLFLLDFLQMPIADPADVNLDGVVDVADVFFVIDRVFSNNAAGAAAGSDDQE